MRDAHVYTCMGGARSEPAARSRTAAGTTPLVGDGGMGATKSLRKAAVTAGDSKTIDVKLGKSSPSSSFGSPT